MLSVLVKMMLAQAQENVFEKICLPGIQNEFFMLVKVAQEAAKVSPPGSRDFWGWAGCVNVGPLEAAAASHGSLPVTWAACLPWTECELAFSWQAVAFPIRITDSICSLGQKPSIMTIAYSHCEL